MNSLFDCLSCLSSSDTQKWTGVQRIVVVDTSFMYETAPIYVEDQPKFINCACMVSFV